MILAIAVALPIAGCGSDDSDSDTAGEAAATTQSESSGGSQTLALAADPDGAIAFDKTSLSTTAGKTTIAFTNASQAPHAVEVEGNGLEEETETIQGGKAELTVDLKPGTYEFYCPVGDHKEEGMKGELIVK
ncbi:MAG: cupredoxin domain-containing protein [Solirubrobacterales bacterium]